MADTIYCRKSSFTDTDWEKIYEVAFRPDQRTPLSQLHDGLKSGQLLLHRSSSHEGLLCFSVTNILPTVALLAYLATDPDKRSSGIGSKHMKALIAEIRAAHPQLLGMFAEIESTREKGISDEERKHRKRRLAFYHRLGFKRYSASYTIPSYDPGVPDEEGDLIWLDFNTGTLGCDAVASIIKEIYVKAYLLNETDTRVINVPVISGEVAACELPEDLTASVATDVVAPVAEVSTVADAPVQPSAVAGVTNVIDIATATKLVEPATASTPPADTKVTEPMAENPASSVADVAHSPAEEKKN
jgi:GNAT superfamily N-acetyltransferase